MGERLRAAALVVLIAGCGEAASTVPVPKIEETMFAASLGVDLPASTKLDTGEYVRDLEVGTGALVAKGAVLAVTYTGWLVDGTQFDSNAGRAAYSFHYGAGDVIAGWDQGFDGMKGGGTRQLIIPPSLGYGVRGAPPSIPSNAILVFSVKLP